MSGYENPAYSPAPDQFEGKESLKHTKLGFWPDIYCNVAGVVAGGQDRQNILRLASVFVTEKTTLTIDNGGLQLYPDPQNQYDPHAIQVWLAITLRDGKFTNLRCAGFIPRRICTNCKKSFGGKHAEALQCPYCHGPLNMQPISWLNKHMVEGYFSRQIGVWCAVWWINRNPQVKGSTWGCQLAIKFPR